jgi:hypothetical protein
MNITTKWQGSSKARTHKKSPINALLFHAYEMSLDCKRVYVILWSRC